MKSRRTKSQTEAVSTRPKARRRILLYVLGGLVVVSLLTWRTPAVEFAHHAARRSFQEQDPRQALAWLKWAERLDAGNPETLLLLARAHGRLQDAAAAAAFVDRARQAGGDEELCRRETWLLDARLGRYREVERHFAELLADPRGEQDEIGEAIFLSCRAARRFAQAKQVLDAWQADDPQNAQPHYLRGLLLSETGFADLAEESYRRAVELQPDHEPALLALAEILVARHDLPEALIRYVAVLRRRPDSSAARLGIARCYRLQGQLDAARAVLSERTEGGLSGELLGELGAVEVAAGNYAQAVELLTQAYDKAPHSSHVRQQLALALAGAGEQEQARRHFAFLDLEHHNRTRIRELAAIVNNDVEYTAARVEIGRLLIELEADDEALSWLYGALELAPRLASAHAVLADFYERRKGSNPNYEKLARQHRSLAEPSVP